MRASDTLPQTFAPSAITRTGRPIPAAIAGARDRRSVAMICKENDDAQERFSEQHESLEQRHSGGQVDHSAQDVRGGERQHHQTRAAEHGYRAASAKSVTRRAMR